LVELPEPQPKRLPATQQITEMEEPFRKASPVLSAPMSYKKQRQSTNSIDNIRMVDKDTSAIITGVSQKATKRDRAYDIAQHLLQNCHIRMIDEALFCHQGTHFEFLSANNAKRMLLLHYREIIAEEGNGRLIDEALKIICLEPTIYEKKMSSSQDLVSFSNGILDLKTGAFHTHTPDWLTFYTINAPYGSQNSHPIFDEFLGFVTGGDIMLMQRIFEVLGCCLVPDMRHKSFFIFQGVPDSGKSILSAFLRGCLNEAAVTATDLFSLGDRFAASSLIGRQLCLGMDLSAETLNARTLSTIKLMTGGDPLFADIKYKDAVTFVNQAKLLLGTNYPVLTQSKDSAFLRRAVTVPFRNSVPRAQQRHDLLDLINQERTAIVNHSIQAYLSLRNRNYIFSGEYQLNGIFHHELEEDIPNSIDGMMKRFVVECCDLDCDAISSFDALFRSFSHQFGAGLISNTKFSSRLLDICAQLGVPVSRCGKKRLAGDPSGNPLASVKGIRLREGV